MRGQAEIQPVSAQAREPEREADRGERERRETREAAVDHGRSRGGPRARGLNQRRLASVSLPTARLANPRSAARATAVFCAKFTAAASRNADAVLGVHE